MDCAEKSVEPFRCTIEIGLLLLLLYMFPSPSSTAALSYFLFGMLGEIH